METANISHRAIGADEKAFIGDSAEKFAAKNARELALKNVRHALQLIYRKTDGYTLLGCRVRAKGALENYITLRVAANVPADVVPNAPGDFLLFDTPGLCPDRLEPIEVPQGIALRPDYTVSVFVTFELDGQAAAGEYETVFTLESADGEPLCKDTYVLTVLNAAADETDLKLTNWMHYDGIWRAGTACSRFRRNFTPCLKAICGFIRARVSICCTCLFSRRRSIRRWGMSGAPCSLCA